MHLSFLQGVHLFSTFGIYCLFQPGLLFFSSPYHTVLSITLFFNGLLMYINHFDHQVIRYPKELELSSYINAVNIQLNIASFFSVDVRTLLMIRYLSWVFTFPFILQLDKRVMNPKPEYDIWISSVLSSLCFLTAFFDLMAPSIFLKLGIFTTTILFPVYYNRHLKPAAIKTAYVNITWALYSFVYLAYYCRVVSKEIMFTIYIVLDMMSKFIFTYSYQMFLVKQLTSSYSTLKVIRTFYPMIEMAMANSVVSKEEYDVIQAHLDISRDDLEGLKTQLIDDLFPNQVWKDILSPFKRHTVIPNMVVMFCDLVGYSTFAMNSPLPKVIWHVDSFYTKMDMLVKKNEVQKVETIGDAYLIVSTDVRNMAQCAESFIREYGDQVRIGIHVGEVAACTLGMSKLRYAYVGHTVNMAARLESHGLPGKIHVSEQFMKELSKVADLSVFYYEKREALLTLKGIGEHQTYFLKFNS